METWQSNETVVEIQRGGPGNPILLLDMSATLSGPSGGGQGVVDRFTRNIKGGYIRSSVDVDGDPERWTFDLTTRLQVADFLRQLKRERCEHNIRARYHCGVKTDTTNYNAILSYYQTFGIGFSYTENIANGTTAASPDTMTTVNESASEEVRVRKVKHDDITASVSDFAINDVISIGVEQCTGICGVENDGNQDFWAVTDVDTTPGYQSIGAPNFLYTTDGGTTWTAKAIDVALSANALRVYQFGAFVFVTLGSSGVAYARFQDIKDGVSNPWALATGLSGLTVNALASTTGNDVYAVSNGGNISKSTDGGFSFTTISAGTITTQNLNDIVFASPTVGWIVGNAGVVIKFNNGSFSLTTISGLSANINTVATPDNRTREMYLGTAGGQIYRTRDTGTTWANMAFPATGTGSVKKLAFSGPGGYHLWIVQHNVAGSKSRILRDLSGGALGRDVENVGTFDTPANSIINSFAPSDANTGVSVGEVDGTYAFIGRVA